MLPAPCGWCFAAAVGHRLCVSPLEVGFPMHISSHVVPSPLLGGCVGKGDPPSTTIKVKTSRASKAGSEEEVSLVFPAAEESVWWELG